MSDVIEVKLQSVKYELVDDGGLKLSVEISGDGKITLLNQKNEAKFIFCNSSPDVVRRIANLMLKAVELSEDER